MTELITQCLTLNRGKRKELIKVLTESLERPEEMAKERFAFLYGVASEIFGNGIIGNKRDRNLVLARRFIAYQMLQDGYRRSYIARCLAKNHATVINMLQQMDAMLQVPEAYKAEMAIWHIFKDQIKEKK